jgi:hypothetical protein
MESLPPEIIEMIIIKLKPSDIFQLTLVSPKFNAIVSNSSKILGKFRIDLNTGNKHEQLMGRKYQNAIVRDFGGHFWNVQSIVGGLKKLIIVDSLVDLNDLKMVIESAARLTSLKVSIENRSSGDESESIDGIGGIGRSSKVPKLLKYFEFYGFSQLLPFFSQIQAETIKISTDTRDRHPNVKIIRNFILRQEKLKKLDLKHVNCEVFDENERENLTFEILE